METTQEHVDAARRWLGDAAPADVIEAKARTYAWRPFSSHTPGEVEAHKADVAKVEAYEASLTKVDPDALERSINDWVEKGE